MNTPLRFTIATLSLVLAVGCAKNDGAQAPQGQPGQFPQPQQTKSTQAEADKAIADLAASGPILQQAPEPTLQFTDDELKAYEDLIKKNEENYVRVQSFNGKDGLVVSGQESLEQTRQMIVAKKQALENVRAQKAQVSAIESKDARMSELKAQLETDATELDRQLIPTKNWAPEKLQAYEDGVNRVDATLHEMEVVGGRSFNKSVHQTANNARRALLDAARKNQ